MKYKKKKKEDWKVPVSRKTTMLIEVPINVKCQFKAHCARRGKSMTEVLVEMMRLYYKVDKRIRKKKREKE